MGQALRIQGLKTVSKGWFRASFKLFNSVFDFNSETLCCMLRVDLHLAYRDESYWSALVSEASSGMPKEEVLKQIMLSASKIPMQEL
eukprot:scaffold178657_cov22-Tisochrysis_lutea.AAC.1